MDRVKIVRRLWVIGTNGYFLYMLVSHLVVLAQEQRADELRGFRADTPGIDAILRMVCLASGIVLELAGSRIAKYVNVGYYAGIFAWGLVGALAEVAGLLHANGMTFVFLQEEGLLALAMSVVTWLLYRAGRAAANPTSRQTERPDRSGQGLDLPS